MAKNILRSVNTKFWQDPFVENLEANSKYLFLYLLTNPLTNMLGIYEISIKRISYDTGLKKEIVLKVLKDFEKTEKVYYIDNFIILRNFLKNQNLNANMKTGAINIFNELPMSLKNKLVSNPLKGFESLLKGLKDFGKYEREIEIEREKEIENKNKNKNENKNENFDSDIEKIYNQYPTKCPVRNSSTGKTRKTNFAQIKKLLKDYEPEKLIEIIKRYEAECIKNKTYIKNFSTFLNNIPDFKDEKIELIYMWDLNGTPCKGNENDYQRDKNEYPHNPNLIKFKSAFNPITKKIQLTEGGQWEDL